MTCKFCGGQIKPVVTELDVSRSPGLIPVMLACLECGQPIRLLHKHGVPKPLSKAQKNRVKRMERRLAMRGVSGESRSNQG